MGATNDKDYIDSMIETIETRMVGRIAALEARLDAKFSSMDAKFEVRFSDLRAEMHKGFAEMTKWIVGTVIGMTAVSITMMTLLLYHAPQAGGAATHHHLRPAQPFPARPTVTLEKRRAHHRTNGFARGETGGV